MMGKKIFVSYKYADYSVKNLNWWENSTPRNYVDAFIEKIQNSDDIYKGESDGEDLSGLSEEKIWETLKNRIYDSSITIVFISPGMRETKKQDKDQWIPWEISYSLKEVSRKNKKGETVISHSNAMIAVVLPDENGEYEYYYEKKNCCNSPCVVNHTEKLFDILKENMFNRVKDIQNRICSCNDVVWYGDHSYIESVKWDHFMSNYTHYIDRAIERQNNIDEYTVRKEV